MANLIGKHLEDSPKSSSGNEEEISLNDSGWVVIDRKTFKIKLETEKEKKTALWR